MLAIIFLGEKFSWSHDFLAFLALTGGTVLMIATSSFTDAAMTKDYMLETMLSFRFLMVICICLCTFFISQGTIRQLIINLDLFSVDLSAQRVTDRVLSTLQIQKSLNAFQFDTDEEVYHTTRSSHENSGHLLSSKKDIESAELEEQQEKLPYRELIEVLADMPNE